MSKMRLLVSHREALIAFAHKIVDCPEEAKAEDASYRNALPMVQRAIEKRYPLDDMAVLKRYELVRYLKEIRVQLTVGGIDQFTFRAGEEQQFAYTKDYYSSQSPVIAVDEKTTDAISKWVLAAKTLKAARAVKLAQYEGFIKNATTFEQVLEVWPEAGQVTSIKRNLPAAVSEQTIAFIAADSKRRIRAAEREKAKAA